CPPRQPREFGDGPEITDSGQTRIVRLVFRHVAGEMPDLPDIIADVEAEDPKGTFGRRMKPEKRGQQRSLASAVRAKQTDSLAREAPGKIFQNRMSRQMY